MDRNKAITLLSVLGIALIYIANKSSFVGFGDAVGFLMSAENGFYWGTHATSHFLYLNSLHLFISLFPKYLSFQVAIWYSLLWSAIGLHFLYKTIRVVTQNPSAALAATVLFALSFTYWRQTEIIEVYTMNGAFFTIMLYLIAKDLSKGTSQHTIWVGLVFGISFWVHIQNILLAPMIGLYLIFSLEKNVARYILPIGIPMLLFSLLFVVPMVTGNHTLLAVLFENEGFQDKATSVSLSGILKGAVKSVGYLVYNFLIFTPLLIHGLYITWKRNRQWFWLLVVGILPFWGFSLNYQVPDSYVFFLQSYVLLVIAGGYSLVYLQEKWPKPKAWAMLPIAILLFMPLAYIATFQTAAHTERLADLNRQKAYKGGVKYLLWPGMHDNADILSLSEEIYKTGEKPLGFEEFEWNYEFAVKYLKGKGRL